MTSPVKCYYNFFLIFFQTLKIGIMILNHVKAVHYFWQENERMKMKIVQIFKKMTGIVY